MTTLTYDCPHCGAKNNGFTAHVPSARSGISRNETHTMFLCNSCFGPVVVTAIGRVEIDPSKLPGEITALDSCKVVRIFPEQEKTDIPANLPDPVAKAFKEGCDILKQAPTSAIQTFRRTLEIALKEKSPEIEAWKLEKRIDKMAAEHLITPEIKEWAHQLRLDGNEASHGGDESVETATQLRELTKFILLYIYSIPKQVEITRSAQAKQ